MHYTLHLTNNCNMACKYCYVEGSMEKNMTFETAKKVIDLAAENKGKSTGIIFFGGEPLLLKDLIKEVIKYSNEKEKENGCSFHYKVTTNGTLLDEEFLRFSCDEDLFIALSHDGIQTAHDKNRVNKEGMGTFSVLDEKISLLLEYRPYAPVLMVIDPNTVQYYTDSVIYLYDKGFKYIICSLNYAGGWDEKKLKVLKDEYRKLADFYYEHTMAEDKFYLSPFEVKISSHIQGNNYCHERCELGLRQISISPEGLFYPCIQFVGDEKYAIGDVDSGIDEVNRQRLYTYNEEEKDTCRDCAIRKRCNHYCGCLNKQTTGRIDTVSPILCAHERILLPIADRLAEKLYKKRSAMFIQKHYNDMYPLISYIEDKANLR
jgi:uncharacterized protein